ncbi:MAG: glycosyltransferase family 39 protein [Anaerolineaceae bacterium]|nr:glycosyltransferase family 39 protein [Anaerolineaceae bacterium]
MAQAPRRYWLFGLGVLFLVAVVLFHTNNYTYMHADEYLVYSFTRLERSVPDVITYLAQQDTHPPLWWSFFRVWHQVVGDSEYAGRVQAALFGLMALAVVYQLGKRWFKSPRFGLFALAVLGGNAFFVNYALEIRPYGLILFLSSLSMLLFDRWLTRPTWRKAAFYAASLAALLYVHYFLVILILAQVAYFLIFHLPRHHDGRTLRQMVAVPVIAFALWLPWFPSFLGQVAHLRQAELAGGNARGVVGAGTTTLPTSFEAVRDLALWATNGQLVLYGLAIALGLVVLWRKKGYQLALMWAFGVPVIAFALNTVVAIYTPRYILNFVLGLGLVTGAGLAVIPRPRWRWTALVAFAAVNLLAMPAALPQGNAPFRTVLADVSATAVPGDAFFFPRWGEAGDFTHWMYQTRLPRASEYRDNWVYTLDDAQLYRRVWFITTNWFNAANQAAFHTLEPTHPLQTVYGDCNPQWCLLAQLMEAPPDTQPTLFGDDLAFWGVDVDAVSREVIQTRLWWRVEQTPALNYSIGLHLLDSSGELVAQLDRNILHYGEALETSQLEPGRTYIDSRDLRLPDGLPPGDYYLSLVVYDWQTGDLLPLPDGRDALDLGAVAVP